ncbi:peptidase S8 [Bacillus methanolicus]|uniref:S8 family serine peptidase n=1 Tax=Bacillus methanolicus TaxID=1471 RepID=UPI0023809D64|nr:S8 family serine peptidase [Bacillus methanolicus]MDE3840317.1 peptidase S8 [Bacillus methanolicus]
MKKIIPLLTVILLLMSLTQAYARNLDHPPIPKESPETEKIAIILLKEKRTVPEIKTFISKYPNVKLRYVFEHTINGFSVKGDARSLDELSKGREVALVSPVKTYRVETLENIKLIGGDKVRGIFDRADRRLTGKGVTVGVIDTGIDYNHPDLRRSYGGGHDFVDGDKDPMETKASNSGTNYNNPDVGRHDFVDSDKDPMETKGSNSAGVKYNNPDGGEKDFVDGGNNPMEKKETNSGIDYNQRKGYGSGHDKINDNKNSMKTKAPHWQSTLHGTHVAGIIAANGKIRGVAPEATIIAYRALGPGGAGTSEQVIAAIEQAVKDKVDVLNLSLGNNVNGPDLPISLALNKAVERGITAVASSGNSGPNVWTVGSPGTASKAISVGASTPPRQIPFLTIEGEGDRIKLQPMHGSDHWKIDRTKEITFGYLGEEKDLKNCAGKIVLIERGKLTFTEKARNAQKAGASAVIIYNNTNGSFIGNLDGNIPIPVAALSKKDGERIKRLIEKGKRFTRTILIEEKDTLASFSSRGPVTGTWEIKPDVVAPGVAIESTIPGGYLSLQGTSMAAPHVAGACALIKQAHPDWGPAQIKSALMNTAKPIMNENGTQYRTFEQGAGRIQLEKAVKPESLVIPGSLQFGMFQLSDKLHEHKAVIEVQNVGSSTKNYSFSIPKQTAGIRWKFPLSFRLKPREKKKLEIRMSADPAVLTKKLYDGNLILHEDSNEIRIPYIYVLEEPDYPRVMGFDFGIGDKENTYRYEVYLPGGAEEFGIALFQPDDYRFIGFLDWERNVGKGLLQKEIKRDRLPKEGLYLVKVFVKKKGKEDMIEAMIEILPELTESRWK